MNPERRFILKSGFLGAAILASATKISVELSEEKRTADYISSSQEKGILITQAQAERRVDQFNNKKTLVGGRLGFVAGICAQIVLGPK